MYDIDNADERMKQLIDGWMDNDFLDGMTEEGLQQISAIKVDVSGIVGDLHYSMEDKSLKKLTEVLRVKIAMDAIVKQVPELAKYDVKDIWGYFQWRCQEACDYYDEDELEESNEEDDGLFKDGELKSYVLGMFNEKIRDLSHKNRNFRAELLRVKAMKELMVSIFDSVCMDDYSVGAAGREYAKFKEDNR